MAAWVRCLVGALQSYRETNNLLTIAIRDRCGWLSIMEGYRASQWCNLPLATQLFPSLEAGEVHFFSLSRDGQHLLFYLGAEGATNSGLSPLTKAIARDCSLGGVANTYHRVHQVWCARVLTVNVGNGDLFALELEVRWCGRQGHLSAGFCTTQRCCGSLKYTTSFGNSEVYNIIERICNTQHCFVTLKYTTLLLSEYATHNIVG